MIIFWLSSVGLVLIAILCIAWPLLISFRTTDSSRKKVNIGAFQEHLNELDILLQCNEITQAQYDIQKKELENTLWEDVRVDAIQTLTTHNKKILLMLAIVIPLCAFGLYEWWGSYGDVKLSKAIEHSVMAASEDERNVAYQEIISLLQKNTQAYPDNFEHWYLLGQFYIQTKNYQKGADAFGHAVSLKVDDADALAQYAQALYFAENNKLTFAVTSTAEQALKLDSNQPTALGLMGIAAMENKQYKQAIMYWQKILWIVGDQDAGVPALRGGINYAKSILQKQGQWPAIYVQLKIDPALIKSPSQWVFIYAREPGVPQPVAVVRMRLTELPPVVTLDDTAAMPNGVLLSSVKKVEVVARLSDTGSAQASPSDKQVISRVISPSPRGENLVLLLK